MRLKTKQTNIKKKTKQTRKHAYKNITINNNQADKNNKQK